MMYSKTLQQINGKYLYFRLHKSNKSLDMSVMNSNAHF